jgi:glutaconyl-CoA/methylmalonyl-CoA decarboxylase subunit gamma
VKAPIPGTIISISVAEGEQVKHGQELCILEAMKMKNAIRSGRDGKIAKILVKEGDSVQHSQVLMEYSD